MSALERVIPTPALRDSHRQTRELALSIDGMRSTADQPGFHVLADDVEREVVVGAIGKVWHLEIPFIHAADAERPSARSRSLYS